MNLNAEHIKRLNFKAPATWIATWFGCGLMRPAPGTWGTLGALPFGMILLTLGGKIALAAALVLVTFIGYWSARRFEEMVGDHDNSMIVIDEAAGLFITLLIGGTMAPLSFVLAFLLFRFFDILKPWPVSWLDQKVPGAWGVMLDDLAAGVYAGLCLWAIGWGINHYALAG